MPVITGTGFHGEGRQAVRKAAEAAGAGYSGDLQKHTTTHLVVSDTAGATASAKLQRAAEWGIPALQWAWLKQSAARGRLLPTGLYLYSGAELDGAHAKPRATPLQQRRSGSTANGAAAGVAKSTAHGNPAHSAPADKARPHERPTGLGAIGRSTGGGAACSGDDGDSSSSATEQQEDGGQENAAPQQQQQQQGDICSAEPRQGQSPGQADALAAELDELQLSGSAHAALAFGSPFEAGSIRLAAEEAAAAAAASQAGSCTCTEDEGIDCAQAPPASSNSGTPVPLPSPAQQRHPAASMHASATGPASPQGMSAAAAQACSDIGRDSHMAAPSTVASSSQDLWKSPAASAVRRMPLQSPSVHLQGLATPGRGAAGSGAVIALKVLARPPRGNTVADFHGLGRKHLQRVQFAEQVQVVGAAMVLSTKDKKVAVVLQPPAAAADDIDAPVGGGSGVPPPVLTELKSLYCMPSGDYWVEYSRFYTADDVDDMAAQCGQPIALPTGFDRRHELLKGIQRFHCPVAHVREQKRLRHSKQVGPMRRNDGGGLFWRSCFDTELMRCVTDTPVTQFIA